MTIRINSRTLARALRAANKVVETRNTMPVLDMVRIETSEGAVVITTTNLDIAYTQRITDVAQEGDFSACVDARRLLSMASAATGDIVLTKDGQRVAIKSGRSRWVLPALPGDDLPEVSMDDMPDLLEYAAGPLAEAINSTIWAASNEEVRYYLNGIYFDSEGDQLRLVATNGHVLAQTESGLPWPSAADSVIVPTKLAEIIADACHGVESVSLSWDASKMRVVAGDVSIVGKLIDGSFPDYRRVIPDTDEPFAINREDLLGAVQRVQLAGDSKTRGIALTREDGALAITMSLDGFEGSENVEAGCGEGHKSGFNASYLDKALSAFNCETVRFDQSAPDAPARISEDHGKLLAVVMPMRV